MSALPGWVMYIWLFYCGCQVFETRFRTNLWALAFIISVCMTACTPPVPGPVVPDAQVDSGCQTLDRITTDRLIRNPDGTALVIHCEAGAP